MNAGLLSVSQSVNPSSYCKQLPGALIFLPNGINASVSAAPMTMRLCARLSA